MKSPNFKIQSPVTDSFITIEPLINPESHSVPPLASANLVTDLAVLSSGQLSAPDVRDATSVAASILAWDGYPESDLQSQSTLQSQAVIPVLAPAKPGAQPAVINHDLVGAPSPELSLQSQSVLSSVA